MLTCTLRVRILLGTVIPLALSAVTLIGAHYAVGGVGRAAENLGRSQAAAAAVESLDGELQTLERNLLVHAGYDPGPVHSTADYSRARVTAALEKFRGAAAPLDLPGQVDTLETLALSALDTLMAAQAGRAGHEALVGAAGMAARAAELQFELAAMSRARVQVYRGSYLTAQRRLERISIAVVIVGALVLLAAALESTRATRWIAGASAAATEFANGRFEARIAVEGPKEIQALGHAINAAGAAVAERDAWLQTAVSEAGRQRDLLSAVFEATTDGLLLYGHGGDIILANARCRELLSIDPQDFHKKNAAAMQDDVRRRCEEPDAYPQALANHFVQAGAPWQDRLVVLEPRRRVLRRASVPLMRDHAVVGRVFTYTDITSEVDLDRMKSEFVAMASHELRTPLTSIHGALQLAVAGSGERILPEDRELMQISLDSTERLVRLVNDLLDLSKIEAGKMPMRRSALAPAVLVRQAADAMGGQAAQAGIRIEAHAQTVDAHVDGDADLLNRVLLNLVSNALKYSSTGTTVSVTAHTTPAGLQFSVDDEGPGIDPAQALQLFQPFSRVGAQEFDRTTGTGLGLAIARAIVEQHGGRIWAERRATGGSRFAFTLAAPQADLQCIA